jgi:hypothetical protein
MTLLTMCGWLGDSWIGTAIRQSKWGFAVIEMVHLLALALLGGAILVTGLRVFGFFFKKQPPGEIARDLRLPLTGSFAVMIVSGVLLFMDGPPRYYGNVAFRVKLLLILGASVTTFMVYLIGVGARPHQTVPISMKAMASLSLLLWLSAGIAGRVIGVL